MALTTHSRVEALNGLAGESYADVRAYVREQAWKAGLLPVEPPKGMRDDYPADHDRTREGEPA